MECGGILEVSDPAQVIEILQKPTLGKWHDSTSLTIPGAQKDQIVFSDFVLGEGTFGNVTVGNWAGLDVAIKHNYSK